MHVQFVWGYVCVKAHACMLSAYGVHRLTLGVIPQEFPAFSFFIYFVYLLKEGEGMLFPQCLNGGQRRTSRSGFSPSTA